MARARAEAKADEIRRVAWLTATLTGVVKVPNYDRCFPGEKPEPRRSTTSDLFDYFQGVQAERIMMKERRDH